MQIEMQRYCRLLLATGISATIAVFVLYSTKFNTAKLQQLNEDIKNGGNTIGQLHQEEKRPWKKEYFLIVSAVSSNHYEEAKDMIGSAQQFLPTRRIVMYDLGLEESQRKELDKFCNVELKTFGFEQYPPHFKTLDKYAWKPIIIRQLALEAEYLFWADASIRFIKDFESSFSKLDKFPVKGRHHGIDIIQLTHAGTLEYLNVTREAMQNLNGIEAVLVLFKTNEVAMHIIDVWCDCAMHEDCIAPKKAIRGSCNFNLVKPGSTKYIGCHRFDQSALNVVIVREYGKKVYKYIIDSLVETSLKVIRHPSYEYTVKKC